MAQIADESYIKMIEAQSQGAAQDPADARLWVKFETRPMQNEAKSTEAGRPIFEDTEWIKIMVPGDRDTEEHPVNDHDRARFAKQYAAWKATGGSEQTGTPLEAWPQITRSQVEELRFFKVFTVEQLSQVPDVLAAKFMGINALKAKAAAYLAAAEGDAPTVKLQAELSKRDEEIATLQRALKEQGDKLEQVLKQRR